MLKLLSTAAVVATTAIAVYAANQVSVQTTGEEICVMSNGTPNHAIGTFPNSGNPHSFKAQKVEYCFDATPEKTANASTASTSGVSVTGIPLRPGTADYYDASSPRGHSRDARSGWNLEGMGSAEALGLDANNAHVDERGLYHYHGMPAALIKYNGSTLMGYAADGREIHYVGAQAASSWQLKSGTRPTAPGGAFDGQYEEDWEFVQGSGNLDQCNGAKLDGEYVYFATDTFPFFPRCFWGDVSADFTGRG